MANTNTKKDFAASAVVDQILALLDKGVAPWKKDWSGCRLAPQSIDGREYRGVNFFLLAFAGMLGGKTYSTPIYGTFNKIKDVGGIVRKGEHGTPVVYWGAAKDRDAEGNEVIDEKTGEAKVHFFLRRYTVFNIEQCDGIPEKIAKRGEGETYDTKPLEVAERVVSGMKDAPKIRIEGHQPCYRPSTDEVIMPDIKTFKTSEGYYAALFHELAHSTGSKKRLDRQYKEDRETAYGREELVAEMAAAMVCAAVGIANDMEMTAAYCKGWADSIRKMPAKSIVAAASAAQKAADWILGDVVKKSGKVDQDQAEGGQE